MAIFEPMIRLVPILIVVCLFGVQIVHAQIRVRTLLIKKNDVYDLSKTGSDILVADTIIMNDSARLILNKLKPDNFLRATVMIVGKGCVIDGRGKEGSPGRNGRNGLTPFGPCQNGTAGRNGTAGLDGTRGVNLSMYVEKLEIKGTLIIDLTGGKGGRGGNGGDGGSGSSGTVHCLGGNGGNGGNAGQGGNGADGGRLMLACKATPSIEDLIGKSIFLRYTGGRPGEAGRPGYSGAAGLGPSNKNGRNGSSGAESTRGISGGHGTVTFN